MVPRAGLEVLAKSKFNVHTEDITPATRLWVGCLLSTHIPKQRTLFFREYNIPTVNRQHILMEDLKLSLKNVIYVLMTYVYIILLVYFLIVIFSYSCLFLVLQMYYSHVFLAHSTSYISSPLTSSPSFHQQRTATTPLVPVTLFYPQAYQCSKFR